MARMLIECNWKELEESLKNRKSPVSLLGLGRKREVSLYTDKAIEHTCHGRIVFGGRRLGGTYGNG